MNHATHNPLQPVPTPRFVSPRKRIPYHHKDVQKPILRAFKGLLPSVQETPDKRVKYGITSANSKEKLQSQPADPTFLNEVIGPKLIAGRLELISMLKQKDLAEGVKSLLLNLRLPDPDCDIERYRFTTNRNGSRSPYVCWAFENPDKPFIPIETVIAKIAPNYQGIERQPKNKLTRIFRWKLVSAGAVVAALILGSILLKKNTAKDQVSTPAPIQLPSSETQDTALPAGTDLDPQLTILSN